MREAAIEQFSYCNQLVEQFIKVIDAPVKARSSAYYCGVDLGTACVVTAVLDENKQPVAGAYQYADVVRDGMVIDYIGAVRIVQRMKQKIEDALNTELIYAAAAIPPGTSDLDGGIVRNVVQGAGFEVTNVLDEPTAANSLTRLRDGAIVDIGGGTTGISIIKDGKVVFVDDEPTGGTHFSLVLAGAYKMSFDEAELYKRDYRNHQEFFPIVRPVIEKIGGLITYMVEGYDVDQLVLVGGSSCLTGIEQEIEQITGIKTYKPSNPLFVTPLGIASNCIIEEAE